MASSVSLPMLRIGELSRRVGVSDHVLRAWESRYGLLQPVRSAGGFRLYSEADAQRVRRMRAHLASGLSAAEAAQAVLGEDSEPRTETARPGHLPATAGELSGALRRALDAFDEPAAQTVLDRLISDLSLTTVFREVVLPYLAELGQRWEQGTASIAQEHFASNLIHGRLAGLARGWGNGRGPHAVLACPPGEFHDLALMIFGIVLNRTGWKIDYLGINTPVEELARVVDARRPGLVVMATTMPEILKPVAEQLTMLARRVPLVLAGPGATPQLAAAVQARLVSGDPVAAAEKIGWPLPIPNHQEPS